MTFRHWIPRATTSARVSLMGVVAVLALVACGSGDTNEPSSDRSATSAAAKFPDVRQVELTEEGDGSFTVAVTLSSPYDSPKRYADGWRVSGPDGTVLGTMTLGHDHASEQPFTRTQTGLRIPDDVDTVELEGHDTENGYGGTTKIAKVPGR